MTGAVALLTTLLVASTPPRFEVEEKRIVLGRTESTVVHIFVDEQSGDEQRPLRASVNVGSFGEITREGPGRYRAVYVPPPTRFPQVALVAVWRETGPEAPISFFRIPLYGVTFLPVTTKPKSEIVVQVAGSSFGPLKANARGLAAVELVVPPGAKEAEVAATNPRGLQTRGKSALDVPDYNRVTTAVVPHAIVADGKAFARLEVFYDLGGAECPPDRIHVQPSVGTARFESAREGRYVYRYTPPAGSAETSVRFTVRVDGDPHSAGAVTLALGLPEPARVVLRPPQQKLRADGKAQGALELFVFDSAGMGLPAQKLVLTANGEELPPVKDLGGGVYQASYVAPRKYPPEGLVQFTALAGPASAQVNYQLQAALIPTDVRANFYPAPVPADGRTRAEVILDVRDEAGMPLDGAELLASASDGSLSPLEPLGEGRYRASYVAEERAIDGTPELHFAQATGGFRRTIEVPVRADPGRLLLGARTSASFGLSGLLLPSVGLDAWAPLRMGSNWFGVGVSSSVGRTSQLQSGPGGLSTRSEVTVVPLALRAGMEVFATRRLSLTLGVGAQVTYARFATTLLDKAETAFGAGGLGFLSLALRLGPGQGFAEAGFGYAPVRGQLFRLDAGGASLSVGYRFGVL